MVGDVAWHQKNPKLLGSVGDDKQLLFWDTSMDGAKPTTVIPNVRKDSDGQKKDTYVAGRENKKDGNRRKKKGRKKKRRQDRTGGWRLSGGAGVVQRSRARVAVGSTPGWFGCFIGIT